MPNEIRLWSVEDGDKLNEIRQTALGLESRLQEWLARDISILDPNLLVIGREVETDFGGFIDLLCLDATGSSSSVPASTRVRNGSSSTYPILTG